MGCKSLFSFSSYRANFMLSPRFIDISQPSWVNIQMFAPMGSEQVLHLMQTVITDPEWNKEGQMFTSEKLKLLNHFNICNQMEIIHYPD